MNKSYTAIGIALLITSNLIFSAAVAGNKKPLVLRKIMQDLGESMQSITDGISREDWKLVKAEARLVADHPKPPFGEKLRILGFVGTKARTFKKYDNQTHNAAVELEQVASSQDGLAVIKAFSLLQNSCMKCHQSFRKPFLMNFYEE